MSIVAKSTQFYSMFDPRSIGGCALWMDAADSNTIVLGAGTNITTWLDKSGRGCNATGVNNPTYSNGRVNFLRSSSQRFTLPNSTLPTGDLPYGYFIVCSFDTASANCGLIGGGTYNSARQVFALRSMNTTTRALLTYWWSDDFQTLSNAFTLNSSTLVESTYNPTAGALLRNMYVNGVLRASNNPTGVRNQTISNNTIGTTNGTSELMSGWIGEILVYSNSFSNISQRQAVEGYLAWKWGIQANLPASHPWKSYAPFTRPFQPIDKDVGLVLWLDAADPSTMTISGANVTQWIDKSVQGVVFSNQIATQAVYNSNLINGLPGIDLTNGSGFISTTSPLISSNLSWAGVVVVKSGIGTWGSIFTHGNRDNDFAVERNSISAGTTLHFQTANDNAGLDIAYTLDRADVYLGTIRTGTSRFFERIGGGTTTTITGTNSLTMTSTNNLIRIGRSDAGEAFNSYIGEILYYNRVLTDAEQQDVESYLTNKWNITGLTTSNMYVNKRALPSTPMFFPTANSSNNCILWIDAADKSTITFSNGNVSAINDKSPRGYNLSRSYTAGFEITYNTTLNGLPTMLFPNDPADNSNTRTFLSNANTFSISNSAHICLFVIRCNPYVLQGTSTPRSFASIFPFEINTTDGLQAGLRRTTSNWNIVYSHSGRGVYSSNTTIISSNSNVTSTNLPVIGVVHRTTTSSTTNSYNGILQTQSNLTSILTNGGQVRVGINFQNQELCELIVYNSRITTDEIQRTEGYLAWKWGLQNLLPTTHAYYKIRP